MSATDDTLFETMVRVENKDIFVDLKKNKGGVYLKISERNGTSRNTVLIPSSGIPRLRAVLDDVTKISSKVKSVSRERKTRAVSDPEIVSRSLYVSGLSWDTTDEELAGHFGQAGAVLRAVVLRQRRGGNPRSSMGCGVVEFETKETAALAVETLNDSELKGRMIHCREDRAPEAADDSSDSGAAAGGAPAAAAVASSAAAPKAPRPKKVRPTDEERVADPCKVFVSGLAWETISEELAHLFAGVGPVVTAEIMTTRKGRSMGTGTVVFSDAASVGAAVDEFNGADFNGRRISVRQYYQ